MHMAVLIRLVCLVVLLMVPAVAGVAESLQLQEQEIKAGLLYNFLKYIDWPANQPPSVTVCIFGDDPFNGYLDSMNGRIVNRHPIALRRIRVVTETETCKLLFVNADEQGRWPQLRTFLTGKSVLTVSDFAGFAAAGGMIEFGHKDNHISVNLNMEAVVAARLHVQDRLLRLVTVVHSGEKY